MTELSSITFHEKANAASPIVVDFWAEWCMPCKILSPVMEELDGELGEKAEFCKVNVDDCNDIAVEYNIASIPTVVLIKGGQEVARVVGVQPKEKLKELLEQHL